jgi:dUTP pyrophosphatase
MLPVKIKTVRRVNGVAPFPSQGSEEAAGWDLRFAGSAPVLLAPGERAVLPLGIALVIPAGWYGEIRPRSGLAVREGLHMLAGVIDSDYRGELNAILINLSEQQRVINPLDRIAQIVFHNHAIVAWEPVTELPDSDRGAKGFGSSGVS